jgi:hypothetical protein
MRSGPRIVLLALALAACGATPHRDEGHEHARRDPEPREVDDEEPPPPPDVRDLAADATFADLVAIIARQDHLRASDSDAGCLLRTTGAGFRIEADLAVAVRPLPEVATDLDARLEHAPGPVRVLTRYGSYGESGQLGASALTTTAPPREPVATLLVQTDRGVYLRYTDHPASSAGPLPIATIATALAGSSTVFVTAEGGVALTDLRELLAALPAGLAGHVGLALLLSDDTRLPAVAATSTVEDVALCEGGLEPLPDDAPVGDLGTERLLAGLAPLRSAGEICVGTSTGTGARGGRVVVDVRIGAGGNVSAACIREDETGDATLRACLVHALRSLVFDDPGGVIDFELPLVLAPGLSHRQRALCE